MFFGPDSQMDNEGAAYFGWIIEDEESDQPLTLWPENVDPVHVFQALHTQWNTDRAGRRTSLKYEALPATFMLTGIKRKSWPEIFRDLQLMEDEALRLLNDR